MASGRMAFIARAPSDWCSSAVHLVVDVSARHADRLEAGEHGLEEARLRLLALLAGGLALELADARAAGEDVRGGGVGNVLAQQGLGDPAGANVRTVTGDVRLAAQRVHDVELAGMAGRQLLELPAKDDVVPGLVAVDQDVAQLHPGLEAVPDDAHVRHDPGTGADVDQSVGARLDVGGEDVRAAEAGEHHAGAGRHAVGQEWRHQRRVLGGPRDVQLFLDGHRDAAVVRRRAHRVGPRRLALALDVLEELDEAVQRRELVRADGQELPGLVLHALAAGEEHQGGGVGGLADGLLDDGLELPDARPGRSPGSRLAGLLEGRFQELVLDLGHRRGQRSARAHRGDRGRARGAVLGVVQPIQGRHDRVLLHLVHPGRPRRAAAGLDLTPTGGAGPAAASDLAEAPDGGDAFARDEQPGVLAPHAEPGGPLEVLLLRAAAVAVAVDVDVVEHDAALVLVVAAADEDLRPVGVDHHSDPVQGALVLMEGSHAIREGLSRGRRCRSAWRARRARGWSSAEIGSGRRQAQWMAAVAAAASVESVAGAGAQCSSNTATRSRATMWASRPSMRCRGKKYTSSPSFMNAIDGLLGGMSGK